MNITNRDKVNTLKGKKIYVIVLRNKNLVTHVKGHKAIIRPILCALIATDWRVKRAFIAYSGE